MGDLELKPGAKDILANMGIAVYQEAYEKKRSLSAHLDALMPQDEYKDGLDGFQRLLKVADITPGTNAQLGIWADEFDSFLKDDNKRSLAPEWMARQWRKISQPAPLIPTNRDVYLSYDQVYGSIDRPYADNAVARWNQ